MKGYKRRRRPENRRCVLKIKQTMEKEAAQFNLKQGSNIMNVYTSSQKRFWHQCFVSLGTTQKIEAVVKMGKPPCAFLLSHALHDVML